MWIAMEWDALTQSILLQNSMCFFGDGDGDEVEQLVPPKTGESEMDGQLSSGSHKPKQTPPSLMTPPQMDHDEPAFSRQTE